MTDEPTVACRHAGTYCSCVCCIATGYAMTRKGRDICKYCLGLLYTPASRVEMGTIRHAIILRRLVRVLAQRVVGWKVLCLVPCCFPASAGSTSKSGRPTDGPKYTMCDAPVLTTVCAGISQRLASCWCAHPGHYCVGCLVELSRHVQYLPWPMLLTAVMT